ncbi:FecCD family ABC transporter permease [Streptococcus cuniculipharyngis]|uniref:Iron ABC transporter permease n=1 Tax=Streptococcus cuniculipharyngis TaxID=1562651 RepID=A0A5C5SB19_9STRE|nr:iron ABC transporter permease [Streptococcus cuniculipharyngis]TWS96659.1 iron ABC transporter permease [Streptococcus cuniculipharyngis]
MTNTKKFLYLIISLLLGALLSFVLGSYQANIFELLTHFDQAQLILLTIRLPRLLACLLGGGSLALSGLLLQTLTQNPLADSGILGINTGAGFVLSFFLATGYLSQGIHTGLLPLVAMLGGFLTVLIVYLLAYKKNHSINPNRLIISGVGLSTMMASLTVTLVGHIDRYKVDYISRWLSGQINGDNWAILTITSPLLILLWLLAYSQYTSLNIMTLNEHTATALGLNLKKERLIILFLATALSAISVILVGNITFVGLIAGHSVRKLFGNNHLISIPAALIMGMLILLLSDSIGRIFLVGLGIPTGLLVAMIGAPYFLSLMLKIK